jgi:HYR domain
MRMSINLLCRCRHAVRLTVAAACLGLLAASPASAETFHVSTTKQLEEAVTKANGNGVANTIELTTGVYLPVKTMIFTNTSGVQTLAGPAGETGKATSGAKLEGTAVAPVTGVSEKELITVNKGVTVTLKHVVVTSGGEAGIAGIVDLGTLNVENATISGNIGTQIQVESGATANLTNSTLSDGLEFGLVDNGTANLLNVTVAHNASSGIGGTGSGTLSLTNTIVGLNGSPQCGSNTITNDHSLISDESCGGEAAFKNKTPLLQTSLSNDGGSTTLYSEKAGSLTLDAGDPAKCPATDQRGFLRPDVTSTACDIGADEYSPTPPTITVPAEIVTPSKGTTGAVVTYSVEASATYALVKTLSCLPASGSTFKNGTTKVECKATDGHENKTTNSFNVKVTTPTHTLTVTATGEGTVTSTPAGIECGQGHTACSAEFEEVAVELKAAPATGNSITWSGACTGSGSCSFNPMSTNESVTATFSAVPLNTGLPVISGTPQGGRTLTTTNGTWEGSPPTSYTYQWEDCNSSGVSCTNIVGATANEYTLTEADLGHTIRVAVVAINASGASAPATSAATAVVEASVAPKVEGKVPFTQTLESTCSPVELGSFKTGLAAIQREEGSKKGPYTATCLLTATSTSEASTLVAADTEVGANKGHLVQPWKAKTYALIAPLEVMATDADSLGATGTGGKVASLASQQTLLNFATPINNDGVTATFSQAIGTKEKLHTGTYSKTITLTLSTTTA